MARSDSVMARSCILADLAISKSDFATTFQTSPRFFFILVAKSSFCVARSDFGVAKSDFRVAKSAFFMARSVLNNDFATQKTDFAT